MSEKSCPSFISFYFSVYRLTRLLGHAVGYNFKNIRNTRLKIGVREEGAYRDPSLKKHQIRTDLFLFPHYLLIFITYI